VKELEPTQREEVAAEEHAPPFKVTLVEHIEYQHVETGSYSWMNPIDRWMVGKPADKACWAYIDRINITREKNTKFLLCFWLPFPLNVAYFMYALIERMFR
jgi:hypothetical protein